MDSYRILGVNEGANEEEIQIAYEDLKRMYDPVVNTSSSAYTKYREIIKAYDSIKDEHERILYNLESKVKKNISTKEDKQVSEDYSLFDFDTFIDTKSHSIVYDHLELEETSKYSLIEIDQSLNREIRVKHSTNINNLIHKKVDYLDFILETTKEVEINVLDKCDECVLTYSTCITCNGLGKANYKEGVVNCPTCEGRGEIGLSDCNTCNNRGHLLSKRKVNLNLIKNEAPVQEFILSEYNDLKVVLEARDTNNIKIEGNKLLINYHLTREEIKYGINKKYVTTSGTLNVTSPPYTKNGSKAEYQFNDYKLSFIFISGSYHGDDINNYLFIKESDLYKTLYLNPLTLNFKDKNDDEHNFEFKFNSSLKPLTIKNKGEEGLNEGKSGDLILTPVLTYKRIDNFKYLRFEKQLIDTSLMFNLFGGRTNDLFNIGFKFKNAVLVNKKRNTIYVLSGTKKEKRPLSNYFLINPIIVLIWFLILGLILFIPFNKQSLILVTGLLLVYAIIANIAVSKRV